MKAGGPWHKFRSDTILCQIQHIHACYNGPLKSFRGNKPLVCREQGNHQFTLLHSSLIGFMTSSPSYPLFCTREQIILCSVQPFNPLILAVWPLVAPLSVASTLALGHRWHSASPARWEGWAPGSWGCAVAPGRDDPPKRPASPEACLGPQQCPPASATAPSATRYAPGGGEQHHLNVVNTVYVWMCDAVYFKYNKSVFLQLKLIVHYVLCY